MYKLDERIIRDIKRGGCLKEMIVGFSVAIGFMVGVFILIGLILWLIGLW